MAIPPGTELKPIDKAELEIKFDLAYGQSLKNLHPRIPMPGVLVRASSCPSGSRRYVCFFVGPDGNDLAHAHKIVGPNGEPIGGRVYHPTGLMEDGMWLHV
jgi:hypothetical protein